MHHATNHSVGAVKDGEQTYDCVCDYCGQTFNAVATDLEEIYNELTPDYTIDSDGNVTGLGTWKVVPSYGGFEYSLSMLSETVASIYVKGTQYVNPMLKLVYEFDIPQNTDFYISGKFQYTNKDNSIIGIRKTGWLTFLNTDGSYGTVTNLTLDDSGENPVYYSNSGSHTHFKIESGLIEPKTLGTPFTIEAYVPLVRYYNVGVGLDDTPINGGGSLVYTDDNSNNQIIENQFFDQSTSTYYNPVTDESYHVEDWAYDYSTRTYTGYTENGEVKIHYGDEQITVVEGGNTYNYFYSSPADSDNGSGGSGSGSDGDNSGSNTNIWEKLGHLLGTLLGGLIDLITGVIDGLLDGLITLVQTTLDKLGQIVNLFGSFGDALRTLWAWLPEEIITILTAGVSVVVFASVLKIFI